jgi:hypothetical protein
MIAGGLAGDDAHRTAIVNPELFLNRVERHCAA